MVLATAALAWWCVDVERIDGGAEDGSLALVDRVGYATFGEPAVGDLVTIRVRATDDKSPLRGAVTERPDERAQPTQRLARVLAVGGESLRWQGTTLVTAGRTVDVPWKTTCAARTDSPARGLSAVLDRLGVSPATSTPTRVVHRLPTLPAKVPRHHLLVVFDEDGSMRPDIVPLGDLTGTVRLIVDPANLVALRFSESR